MQMFWPFKICISTRLGTGKFSTHHKNKTRTKEEIAFKL